MQVFGLEPAESNVLNGGKQGKIIIRDVVLVMHFGLVKVVSFEEVVRGTIAVFLKRNLKFQCVFLTFGFFSVWFGRTSLDHWNWNWIHTRNPGSRFNGERFHGKKPEMILCYPSELYNIGNSGPRI